ASGLKILRKVGTAQRVESSADTVMDDQEDASKQGEIAELDADEDVTLEKVVIEVAKDANDDEAEPPELKEVIEVVSTSKLMTEVVTAAATTITAAPMPKASATRRKKGVVIRDPEETSTPLVIVHSEPKSKDKGKGILVEGPKPLKKQAHIEQDEAYGRELEAELNANINWNEEIERLEKKRKLNASGLKILRKVGTAQRVESSADTVMDDQEDASKQGEIAELDADEDVTLEKVVIEVAKDANDDEAEPPELKEVIEVVFTAKLMTEVVTAVATTITAAPMPKASATRRRKGVVIRDPEETSTPLVIVHSEPKSLMKK
nr:hypothetical protein [Tanacetum cinerariifolium]